jgi:TPP-dependent pyruvate/acetoin dehydrogenase alpha subunit
MKSEIHDNYLNYSFSTSTGTMSQQDVLSVYKFMLRLRMIEESIASEYHPDDEMKCPIHLCIGQEAVSGVLNKILHPKDYLYCHHRSHGYYLAKKCNLNELISELYGKETGANRGFAGSQDISSSQNNFYAGAILSGSVGISVGTAFSKKYNNDNSIVVCCFGEGATDQGIFWEAINYAALKKLPILFVCENNIYATYSHLSKRMANTDICKKVSSFGLRTERIFGNDVVALFEFLNNVHEDLQNGPIFLEAMTYRVSSHVGPEDDSKIYRTTAEIVKWKKLCPIKNFEKIIVDNQLIDKNSILENITKEIDNAFKFAKSSKYCSVDKWESLNYSNISNVGLKIENNKDHSLHNSDTLPEPY